MDEDGIKEIISRWLTAHSVEVYWEKANSHGWGVFKVEGTRRKPDLYIRRKGECGYSFETAIEVKDGNDSHGVREGNKIIDYMYDYSKNNVVYYVNREITKPKFFLLATQYSIEGHLYSGETVKPLLDSGRHDAIERGELPKVEFVNTFDLVRHLWAEWTRRGRDEYLSLGILVMENGHPLIQSQIFDGKWKQRIYFLDGRKGL